MNLLLASAKFIGSAQTESGVRCMHVEIQNQGAEALPVPVYLIPTRAAGDTFVIDAYEPGTHLLFTGRMYPSKSDLQRCTSLPQHRSKLFRPTRWSIK